MILKISNNNMLLTDILRLTKKIITGLEKKLKVEFLMKRINPQIIFTVLAIHIAILFLIWGGLSTLGAGVVLLVPLIGGTSYISFQKGKQYKTNTRKIVSDEFNCNQLLPFRG